MDFPNYILQLTWLEKCLKRFVSAHLSRSDMVNSPKHLVIYKILGVFVDTLTGDDKYSFLVKDKLTQFIQMLLSKNQKTFSNFFWRF